MKELDVEYIMCPVCGHNTWCGFNCTGCGFGKEVIEPVIK